MRMTVLPSTNCGITHNSGLSRTKQWLFAGKFHIFWVSLDFVGLSWAFGTFGANEEDRFAIDELWDHT